MGGLFFCASGTGIFFAPPAAGGKGGVCCFPKPRRGDRFIAPQSHIFSKPRRGDIAYSIFFAPPAAGGRFGAIRRASMGHLTSPTYPEHSFSAYFLFLHAQKKKQKKGAPSPNSGKKTPFAL